MRRQECFHLCKKHYGRVVHIHDRDGNYHVGKIIDITDDSVWLQPLTKRYNWGFGYGSRYDDDELYGYDDGEYYGDDDWRFDSFHGGAAIELAFGFIVGITLAALFFF